MADVLKNLIEPLELRFNWRDSVQEEAAKRDMLNFRHHSDEQFAAAVRHFRMNRKYSTMPEVGEIAQVLNEITGGRTNAPEHRVGIDYPEIGDEAYAEADEFVRCELGERAAREGWLLGLHDHFRRHRRLPNASEQARMICAARWVDETASVHPSGRTGAKGFASIDHGLSSAVADAARAIVGRRRRLEQRLFGKDPPI